MITWNNVANDVTHLPIMEYFSQCSFVVNTKLLKSLNKGNTILLSSNVRTEVYRHIQTTKKEMGGLLIGKLYTAEPDDIEGVGSLIQITKAIPSLDFEGTPVSLKMATSVWSQANNLLLQDEVIVGWYHSHPNLGAFFSGTDRKTQSAFFNNVYSHGWVIDWVRNEEAWFEGKESLPVENNRIFFINDEDPQKF
jgi:proteasome lid subunit RPN8/RPN11